MHIETFYKQTNRAKKAGGSKTIIIVTQDLMQMRKSQLYLTATPTEYP